MTSVTIARERIPGTSTGWGAIGCGLILLFFSGLALLGSLAANPASRSDDLPTVVGLAVVFVATGVFALYIGVGLAEVLAQRHTAPLLAWALGKAMVAALQGVVALDLSTFVVIALTLALMSLGSAYLPARRALRLDPAAILRQ